MKATPYKVAKCEAVERISKLLPLELSLEGFYIQLYDYEDEATFHFEQGARAPLESHKRIIWWMKKLLTKRGADVQVVSQSSAIIVSQPKGTE